MTDPRFAECRACRGDGTVTYERDHTRLLGAAHAMTSPDCWTETCPRCDGAGNVVVERREADRRREPDLTTALINRITDDRDRLKRELAHANDHLDQVIRENRALRIVVQDQARLLDRADFKHRTTEVARAN